MTQIIKFDVGMSCGGCASAVKRILSKVDGVNDVETFVEEKKVIVKAEDGVSEDDLLQKLLKWSEASGKSVALSA